MLKLTNALKELSGELLFVNPNVISAIYEYPDDDNGGEPVTVIYGPQGEQWKIKENISDVVKMIERS
jgi:uncharacterized protein YlzI (FlbEa/FlbD family)